MSRRPLLLGELQTMEDRATRTVLVTGVSGQWGSRVAGQLLAQPHMRVLGLDREVSDALPSGLDFVKADVRNPLIGEFMRAEQVDTVVHLALRERQWRQESDFDSNVLGTMHLVGSCAEAGVQRIVLKSTMAVYGARADNPMYLGENAPLAARSSYGYVRDALDIEQFLQEFVQEYPDLGIAILRFANIVGPDVDTPLTRLLRLPVWPNLLGFDPLLQVIDQEDVVSALVQAVTTEATGPINVAANGVVPLYKLAAMLGKPVLPVLHSLVYWSWGLLAGFPAGRSLLTWWPLEPDYLRFPWTGDLDRMQDLLAFHPRYSVDQAVSRFAEAVRVEPYSPTAEMRRYAGDRLQETIDRRHSARQNGPSS